MRIVTVLILLIGLVINGVLAFMIFRSSDHVSRETMPLLLAGGVIAGLSLYLTTQLEEEPTAAIVLVFALFTEVVVVRTALRWKRRTT